MRAWVPIGMMLLLLCAGCSNGTGAETPSEALRSFLDAMDRSSWDAGALQDAYHLLGPDARRELQARARRAESLAGREVRPWEMLAQGRFRLRLTPRTGAAMTERIDGDRAVVIVRGNGDGDRAEVPMVEEDGEWRIALEIPPAAGR